MSWVDKQLRQHQTHKMIEKAIRDPRFVQERKKWMDAYTSKAIDSFLLISVDFLHRELGFGQKRIIRFLEFTLRQMQFCQEDGEYFELLNAELEKEVGINVLGRMSRDEQEEKECQKE